MNEEKITKDNNKICAFCGKEKSLGGFHEHRIDKRVYYSCNACNIKYGNKDSIELLDIIIQKDVLPSSEMQVAIDLKDELEYKAKYSKKRCLRCNVIMQKNDPVVFQNGSDILPSVAHVIEGTSTFYTLTCPSCGIVEFFAKEPE